MSEQINKVLANTAQQFTTGEQLQARTNIGAMWTGDMTGYVSYSVIAGDTANSAITSINGSSIGGGGGDTSNCFPKTASALLQPVGDYLSSTDSALFYPYTGNPSGFINSSEQVVTAISDDGVYITSINGKGLSGAGGTGGGGDQVVTSTGGVSPYVTSINGSALSSEQVVTATAWNGTYITSINGTPLSGAGGVSEATVSSIASSYADSAASGKLDNSASSTFYPMEGNPSGFINSTELVVTSTAGTNGKVTSINGSGISSTQTVTATAGDGTYVTSINGMGISGQGGGGGGSYSGVTPVKVDNTANTISVSAIPLDVNSTLTAYNSAGTRYFGLANSADYVKTSNLSAYQKTADMSGYIPTGNSADYQQTTGMSAYQTTAKMSGYFKTSAPLIPYSALEYSAGSTVISAISGSALGAAAFGNPMNVNFGDGMETSISADEHGVSSLNIAVSAHMGALCTHIVWGMAEVWTATAVDQVLPYGNYMVTPAGYNPYYIHWNAVLEAPYAARFDLVESADSRDGTPFGEVILDSWYVQPGNSAFVHLNGVSYGWGNNMYMRYAYIKVHWDENPLNATLNIHAQNGYWCDLCMGTTIGPFLTFPVQ